MNLNEKGSRIANEHEQIEHYSRRFLNLIGAMKVHLLSILLVAISIFHVTVKYIV